MLEEPLRSRIRDACAWARTLPRDPTLLDVVDFPTFMRGLTESGNSNSMVLWSVILEVMGSPTYKTDYDDRFERTVFSMFMDQEIMDLVDLLETNKLYDAVIALGLFATPAMVRASASYLTRDQKLAVCMSRKYQRVFRGKDGRMSKIRALMTGSMMLELAEILWEKEVISFEQYQTVIYLVCTTQQSTRKLGHSCKPAFWKCRQLYQWMTFLTELALDSDIKDFWHPDFDDVGWGLENKRLSGESLALKIGCLCDSPDTGNCTVKHFVLVPGANANFQNLTTSEEMWRLISTNDPNVTWEHPIG